MRSSPRPPPVSVRARPRAERPPPRPPRRTARAACALRAGALGALAAASTGCTRGPLPAVLVPVVTLSFAWERGQHAGGALRDSTRGLSAHVLLTFDGQRLRAPLPTPFDLAPGLSALPCEEDDGACMVESQPFDGALARALGELP